MLGSTSEGFVYQVATATGFELIAIEYALHTRIQYLCKYGLMNMSLSYS